MKITYSGPMMLQWLNNDRCWKTLSAFLVSWVPDEPHTSIAFWLPAGFRTDLASLPGFIRAFNPVNGHHLQPSVAHDYVYRTATVGVTRAEADQMFYDGMIARGTPAYRAWYMHQAVKLFGGSSYVPRT